MAISPPSDIVLDVARAVDPAELETARLALAKRSQVAPGGAVAFPDVGPTASTTAGIGVHLSRESATPATPAAKTYQKFEAVVLQNFLQSMMPKDTDAVYGSGLAGDMWKSQMAEQIANTLAEHGGIGIANRLLKARYAEGDKTLPLTGVSDGTHKAATDMQHKMASAMVQDLQRKLMQPLAGLDTTPSKDAKL